MHKLTHLTLATILTASMIGSVSAEMLETPYSEALTMSSVSEQVYQRLPAKLGEATFSELQIANDALSQSLFAAPATANLHHFNDAIGSGDGLQEWEGSVDMPLWLPQQKQTQQALSDKIMAQLPAYQNRLRLEASGKLREVVWQVKLAESELEQATVVWLTAQKLEQDVAARVQAGDMPNTEALLASSNTLEARTRVVEAESNLAKELTHYSHITGLQALPVEVSEDLATDNVIPLTHPILNQQDQLIAKLQADLAIARYDGSANPNLSVGVKRDRGDDSESFNNSLGLGISIPLNNARYSQPAIATASSALTDAQITRQQLELELEHDLYAARETLTAVQKQLELVTEQDEATQQYYQLQKRAFDLGEINLIDLLRSQVLANDSSSRKRQLEVVIEQKIADVNQSLGRIL